MRLRNDGLLHLSLRCLGTFALAFALAPAAVHAATQINEIRTDNTGPDTDEYFEIKGTPGTSLVGLTYIVIGDAGSAPRCGVIESVTDLGSLSPNAIQADGFYAVCKQAAPSITGTNTYDVLGVTTMNFENGDNVTHMLVSGFTGTLNQDLDTNDDGVFDVTPWTSIVDWVSYITPVAIDCTTGAERVYAPTVLGPAGDNGGTGNNAPSHAYRCNDTNAWALGSFDLPPQGLDSPGKANIACSATPPSILKDIRNVCAPVVSQAVAVTDSIPGATSAILHYTLNGGAELTVNMVGAGTNKWTASIPGQAVNGTRVNYYVTGTNANGTDTGFTWGYFVGTMTVAGLRSNDGTGVNNFRFLGARIHGVVTSDNFSNLNVNTDFYVQDATGGINIFQSGLHPSLPARGNDVFVCGVVSQFNGNLELTTSSSVPSGIEIDVQGAGVLPAPVLVNSCDMDEAYEGKLVRLEYPKVDTLGASNFPGTWRPNDTSKLTNCGTSNAGTFVPSTVDLFIDDATDIDGTTVVSLQIGVTGICIQSDGAAPLDANYRVAPRGLADITYISSISSVNEGLAARLMPVNPNPFNSRTTLRYEIQGSSTPGARTPVRLTVFDVQGKVVRKLVDATQEAGLYEVNLNADDLGGVRSGVFFYQLEVGGRKVATQKLVLSR